MTKLDDQIVLITGGANGIGKATSELFISKGMKVIIVDIDNKIFDVAKLIGAYPLLFDVSIENNWKDIVKKVKKEFHTLDI
jgi:NADP-dependent 3-hydroxy acid dehydrogenase YdfG